MYVQIDGQNVGDPVPTLPAPDNTVPTLAGFRLQFNEAGEIVEAETPIIHITNWTLDADGNATGALGPINVLSGAVLPVPDDPAISSNFVIDLAGSTQFGSVFSVSSVAQNGFTTGRLSGLDISDTGIISPDIPTVKIRYWVRSRWQICQRAGSQEPRWYQLGRNLRIR